MDSCGLILAEHPLKVKQGIPPLTFGQSLKLESEIIEF